MTKRIVLSSGHSFLDVSRKDDTLYGPMVKMRHLHPEVGVDNSFSMSQEAARKLIETLESALEWMNPVKGNDDEVRTEPKSVLPGD